jgi:16S rRNA (guanine527-N7)-methyltransferase
VNGDDPFRGFELEARILARAAECEIDLSPALAAALALHAREVLRENARLKLTSIVEPEAFLERHLGEAFEGAAMLDAGASGDLVDLGSGNGYPGLPIAASRPGLAPLLVEVSPRKAEFLRRALERALEGRGVVLERHVQRAGDLGDVGALRVIVCRAMGSWERVLPRLRPCLEPEGELLLWGGAAVEAVTRRAAWKGLRLVERRPLPCRTASWIWRFRT